MLLSLIIPVYNSSAYLEKCLHSLLQQTYQDFEIVIVNDGSTDNSFQVATDYLSSRDYVQLVSQDNRGVSSARNLGISKATGDWLSFVDSDDYISPDYVDTLLHHINDVDFVVSGCSFLMGHKISEEAIPPDSTFSVSELKHGRASYLRYMTSPVGRLFKKSVIDHFNLMFDESMSFAEDRDFNIQYLSNIETVRMIHYSGYHYQTSVSESLTKKEHPNKFKNDILYWDKVYALLDGADESYLSNLLYNFIVDNIAWIAKRDGLLAVFKETRATKSILNRQFLRNHMDLVKAPMWQKMLVSLNL